MAGKARTPKTAADRAYDKALAAARAAGKSTEECLDAANAAAWAVWDAAQQS